MLSSDLAPQVKTLSGLHHQSVVRYFQAIESANTSQPRYNRGIVLYIKAGKDCRRHRKSFREATVDKPST